VISAVEPERCIPDDMVPLVDCRIIVISEGKKSSCLHLDARLRVSTGLQYLTPTLPPTHKAPSSTNAALLFTMSSRASPRKTIKAELLETPRVLEMCCHLSPPFPASTIVFEKASSDDDDMATQIQILHCKLNSAKSTVARKVTRVHIPADHETVQRAISGQTTQ
jgi:hypothetical protein